MKKSTQPAKKSAKKAAKKGGKKGGKSTKKSVKKSIMDPKATFQGAIVPAIRPLGNSMAKFDDSNTDVPPPELPPEETTNENIDENIDVIIEQLDDAAGIIKNKVKKMPFWVKAVGVLVLLYIVKKMFN